MPDFFGQLTTLQTLNLRCCSLTALPESFGLLTAALQTLDLSTCKITFRESFRQLAALHTLHLDTAVISQPYQSGLAS